MLHNKNMDKYPQIALQAEAITEIVDFSRLFERPGPVELEVGSGKGTFLLAQARAFPETNFLGIEWANKFYRYAVDRLGRWQMDNVRLMRTDAAEFIERYVPDASTRVFHLYFPDPWPKKRHHKRRFFSDANLAGLHRILEQGGRINVATDHDDYFEQMTDVADRAVAAGAFDRVAFIRPAGAKDGEQVGTNYERKYIPEGRTTHTLALQKK